MRKKIAKTATCGLLAVSMLATNVAFNPLDAFAGNVVGQSDFDEGIGLPWHTCETNPAKQTFDISNGTYNVKIVNPGGKDRGGEDRWDLQLRHRGLKIQSGHKYKVAFDVNASNDGNMCSKIGDLSGKIEIWHNGEGLLKTTYPDLNQLGQNHGQGWTLLKIKKGDNHFECEFTADQTLEVAEWAFHYGGGGQYGNGQGGDCFPEGTELKFDNLTLVCETCGDTPGEGCNWDTSNELGYVQPRSDVRINQVGYYTNLSKVASYATDTKLDPVTFVIKDASGKQVYEGKGKQFGTGKDEDTGEYIQLLDFSDFKQAGTGYTIEVSDQNNIQTNKFTKDTYQMWKSEPFSIADAKQGDLYGDTLKNAMNYYYQNRSGVAIESQYVTSGDKTNLAHQAGHVNDMAYVQSKWVKSYAGDGSDVDKSYSIDCTGGWYDAGDHGKYVVNGGISVWTLQNMYESSKNSGKADKWNDGVTMSIPQNYQTSDSSMTFNGTGTPDILDEARVELEWMFKMIVKSDDPTYGKTEAGMVYHKMHDHKWTGLGVQPWNYAEKWGTIRIVKPPTTAATLNVAATAAQAARLWRGIDDSFADKCLENAKLTYEAAKKNPEVYAPLDQAIGGGAYGDDYVEDDFYWAACELYATTGDETYYNDLAKYQNKNDSTGNDKAFSITTNLGGGENSGSFSSFNWGCTAGLGTLSLYLNKKSLKAEDATKVENAIVDAADTYIKQENAEGTGIPYRSTTFEDSVNIGEGVKVTGYEWGSNSFVVNNAMVMAYAYKIKKENKYISGVSTALDYIFGRNGLGISYVTGVGSYHTSNPHHRYWSYELDHSFPKAPDGVMSGGAGSGLQDPYVGGLGYKRGEVAPQKCYVDSIEAWSVNEVTINWNAPFAWVLSFMQDEAAAAPTIDGTIPDEPETTTEATETTTEAGETTTEAGETTTEATETTTEATETTTEAGETTTEATETTTEATETTATRETTTEPATETTKVTETTTENRETPSETITAEPVTETSSNEQTSAEETSTNGQDVTTQKPSTEETSTSGQDVTTQKPSTEETSTSGQDVTTQKPSTEETSTNGQDVTSQQPSSSDDTTKQDTTTNAQETTTKTSQAGLNQSSAVMFVGDQLTLNYTSDSEGTDNVAWSTPTPDVVFVDSNGVVTALKEGVGIVVLTLNGKTYSCVINVVKKAEVPTTTEPTKATETTTAAQQPTQQTETTTAQPVPTTSQQPATTTEPATEPTKATEPVTDAPTKATEPVTDATTTQPATEEPTKQEETTTEAPTTEVPTTTQPAPTTSQQPAPTTAAQQPTTKATEPTTKAPSTNTNTQPTTTPAAGNSQQTVGTIIRYRGIKYKITKVSGTKGEVAVVGAATKNLKKVSVANQLKKNGKTYKVTSVNAKAFKNNKKITKVTIGSNVKKIGSQAFYNCKKLKTISINKNVKRIDKLAFYGTKKVSSVVIKTKKLTTGNVKAKAFAGMGNKVTYRVPKNKVNAYKKLLVKRGAKVTVNVRAGK